MEPFGGGRMPVLLVAGAPGAGKTAAVARWIGEPDFANAAVVVNELGEASLDAQLVRAVAGTTRAVEGGCACCTARGAFAAALATLADGARGAPAERLVVELSGVAHPLPVLEDLAADPRLCERFALRGMVTVVDAEAGIEGLASAEAHAQVAAADVLVVAKGESLGGAQIDRLASGLARINPDAPIVRSDASQARDVWDAVATTPGRELRHVEAALAAGRAADERPRDTLAAMHGDGIRVHTIRRERPVELSEYCLRLANFLERHGDRVLRVKGLVAVRGRRGPAVIQAVRGTLNPVRTLKAWPGEAAPGTLVVVARGVESAEIRAALS